MHTGTSHARATHSRAQPFPPPPLGPTFRLIPFSWVKVTDGMPVASMSMRSSWCGYFLGRSGMSMACNMKGTGELTQKSVNKSTGRRQGTPRAQVESQRGPPGNYSAAGCDDLRVCMLTGMVLPEIWAHTVSKAVVHEPAA